MGWSPADDQAKVTFKALDPDGTQAYSVNRYISHEAETDDRDLSKNRPWNNQSLWRSRFGNLAAKRWILAKSSLQHSGRRKSDILQSNRSAGNPVLKKRNEYTPLIEKAFDESKQTYGARKNSFVLRDMGYHIAPKTVADIMHRNGY